MAKTMTPTAGSNDDNSKQIAIAVAPTTEERQALQAELVRVCGEEFWYVESTDAVAAAQDLANRLDDERKPHIAVVSPKILHYLLQKKLVVAEQIGLLVLERADEIHEVSPSLYRMIFTASQLSSKSASTSSPRIFATTKKPASELDWSGQNPLYRHIQIFNVVPVLTPDIVDTLDKKREPVYPPLLAEVFDPNQADNAPWKLPVDVRDFLMGSNDRKVDFVRTLRLELEMGNSAAVYDERKKQDRVNRFIQDAQTVYQHLGLWCLLKFVELELLANLRACLVDDVDNINHKRRRQLAQASTTTEIEDEDDETADDLQIAGEDAEEGEEPFRESMDSISELIAAATGLDEAKSAKIQGIQRVLSWLSVKMEETGVSSATPRLLKAAAVVRSQLVNGKSDKRCWVFVERRSYCAVIAEYLSVYLSDLGIPPTCSMLGRSNARITGSLYFSSYLKVVTLFNECKTNVLVTTSIAKKSQRVTVEPELCDLVIIFDELLESDKLVELGRRAHSSFGVVKYMLPHGKIDLKKYNILVRKMKERIQLEVENRDLPSSVTHPSRLNESEPQGTSTLQPSTDRVPLKKRGGSAVQEKYELVNKETGVVLNLKNSVDCLGALCDTIPGLDTFDKHAQYSVKRTPVSTDDKIDELKAEADARTAGDELQEGGESSRFLHSATLRLPVMLGIKKQISSEMVNSDEEAKAIVAFKACLELVKRGLLDAHFRPNLSGDEASVFRRKPHENTRPTRPTTATDSPATSIDNASLSAQPQQRLGDLSTQDTYDLPPVSARELGLPTLRSLVDQHDDASPKPIKMCFYGIQGLQFAILSTKELYTGNTNTGWRYDFATSEVMEPVIHRVTLEMRPVEMQLSKSELLEALHFHLVTIRLVCMGVDDALREVKVFGDDVWKEFSEQNDKGYLVVPSKLDANGQDCVLDWDYLRDIITKPLLMDCWPLPSVEIPEDEWICVPTNRHNVSYVVQSVTGELAGDRIKSLLEDDAAWAHHMKTSKSSPGNPSFGRWHTRTQLQEADTSQPLIHGIQVPTIVPLIRRVMQRNHDDASTAQSKTKFNERLFLPQFTTLLRMNKSRFFEAMGIVPLLYEFERKCQMSNLMMQIGLEVDLALLDDATTKPAYERLEILGDTFLKLETSWFMYEHRRDILEEGFLTQLRRDIIRNDRLNHFALTVNLHHYILYPAEIEQHPFRCWKPSCVGKTPDAIVAPSKWIADVLEAVCGAYLVGHGEMGARHFLKWIGVSVPEVPFEYARPFYPDCYPNVLYDDDDIDTIAARHDLGFVTDRYEGLSIRLATLQQRLRYTFRNKLLLLEAIAHPSVGPLEIRFTKSNVDTGAEADSTRRWKHNYERMEYLGDAVIEYLTLSYAFMMYDKWLPGSLSQWKSATVSNDALGKTAIACFGIDECILSGALKIDRETLQVVSQVERKYTRSSNEESGSLLSSFASSNSSRRPSTGSRKPSAVNALSLPKMFADVFEALVAAVFLDSGHDLQRVRDVFFGPLIDTVGNEAIAYVCRESGLSLHEVAGRGDEDSEHLMMLSDEDDDD
ncbi:hypothetical protein Poli38472_004684 [Pythium oligandrum]|uniref:Uncharacterized protein n=1 Tax=Pythium oligandrum TaxID=41045 RepID=A0A8K1CB79_PYTOL|nr:hypothetical protein Poli38472_004684 [Pythium oligandrum]|eukprot:TMW59615.1 hypothetical protein Poli38472_004684 [Pythium oligandrum]